MNNRNLLLLGAAVFLGLIAVYLANTYFSALEGQQEEYVAETRLTKIAVASQPIEYGGRLTNTNIRLADWPAGTVPPGAFSDLADVLNNRVALRPLVAGEPIIASRVSGTDGRAVLSANLPEGAVAVAIPISAVSSVAGFVRPGDSVDVLLTRQIPGDGAGADDKMVDVIMQGVQVLAIDQTANESATDPSVGATATVQTDHVGAQKLALARELGTLTLALRNVGSQNFDRMRTVTKRDLTFSNLYIGGRGSRSSAPAAPSQPAPQRAVLAQPPAVPVRRYTGPTMTVYRKAEATDYEVNRGS